MKTKHPITVKTATAILHHYFHTDPRAISQIHGGLANYVYDAKIRGEELVVRISSKPGRLQFFLKEQWAMRKVSGLKVPVPEILEVGNELDGSPYMILKKITGKSADSSGNRIATLRRLAEYMRTINSISTTGYGHVFDWSTNQLSRNESWIGFLEDELGIDARLELFKKLKIFSRQKLGRLESAMRNLKKLNFKPKLNHGDIRLKNVIVDEKGEIKAIIDWEHSISGPTPHWDLSIALHDLSIDEKQAFVESYGLSPSDFDEIAQFLTTLNVFNYSTALAKAAAKKESGRVSHLKSRLNGAFDLFDF